MIDFVFKKAQNQTRKRKSDDAENAADTEGRDAQEDTSITQFQELSQAFASQEGPVVEKSSADGINMDIGYGPEGSTVQDSTFFTDREVMQKTILRGTPVVQRKDMIAILKKYFYV